MRLGADAGHALAGQWAFRFSTIPVLAAALGAFWVGNVVSLLRTGHLAWDGAVATWTRLGFLGAWGAASASLALSGRYAAPRFLAWLPGLWLPAVPVLLTALALLASAMLRAVAADVAQRIADGHFVPLQVLRLAAPGSMLKARAGEIPRAFGTGLGVPDPIFSLSGLAISLVGAHTVPSGVLIASNLAGAGVPLAALPVLQLCLRGPLDRFDAAPGAAAHSSASRSCWRRLSSQRCS